MTMEVLGDILKWAVIGVSVPLCWAATFLLFRQAGRRPGNIVLRFVVLAVLALALLATVFAIVFVNNDWPSPPLDLPTTRVMTRGAVFLITTGVALICLWIYRRDE